jgi:hypothetical protein
MTYTTNTTELTWDGVTAASYFRKGKDAAMLYHLRVDGAPAGKAKEDGASLCGRIEADHMAGMVAPWGTPAAREQCPHCVRLQAKLGLPMAGE